MMSCGACAETNWIYPAGLRPNHSASSLLLVQSHLKDNNGEMQIFGPLAGGIDI
jgi:hypothetical protein